MCRKLALISLSCLYLLLSRAACADPPASLPERVKLDAAWIKEESPELGGLAVVEMVANFYRQPLTEDQKDWLRACSKKTSGITGNDLLMVMKTAEYEAVIFSGELSPQEPAGLYYQLRQRRPLMVMVTSKDGRNSHFDLIVGYNQNQAKLYFIDPSTGPLTLSTRDFAPAWEKAHCFTLLAMPEKLVDPSAPSKHH
jgi:ABC-type bacteriocin/lantibiotic exporter with double-glycine peptidase domain